MAIRNLSIIGVGLLGGSIGLAARERISGVHVVGYGHRRSTLQSALELKAIDEAADSLASSVAKADLVILCTPVGQFGRILTDIRAHLSSQAIVTDVGSTKASVVKAGEKILGRRFVGSHPMAGSEKRGVKFAKADLFEKALCILTPTPRSQPTAVRAVEAFWKTLGMNLVKISPAEHDRMLAEVSHLPHVVAAALMGIPSRRAMALSGKGFLDTTRVAGGDGELWRDILLDNRGNMLSSLAKLRGELDAVERLIKEGDLPGLARWLNQRRRKREAINPKFENRNTKQNQNSNKE